MVVKRGMDGENLVRQRKRLKGVNRKPLKSLVGPHGLELNRP